MFVKRHFSKVVVLAIVALGAYLLFGASDQRDIGKVLRGFARATRFSPSESTERRSRQIEEAMRSHAIDSLVISVSDLGSFRGREIVEELLSEARGLGFESSIEETNIHVEAERRARAQLWVEFRLSAPGGEQRQRRPVAVDLERRQPGWRIVRIDVGGLPRDEPEARP